jgi:hypothetical protein
MPLSTPNIFPVPGEDSMSLHEPSLKTYRLLSDLVSREKDDDDNVSASLFKAGTVLMCLYLGKHPYICNLAGDTSFSVSDMFERADIVDIVERFSEEETYSFIDKLYKLVDEHVLPLSKKSENAEKND